MKQALATAIGALCVSAFPAIAETTQCTEIRSIPATITEQGVYCLNENLTMADATGVAILIETNNVVIDLNGRKLGGSAAGDATRANGIEAINRKNITIRNGIIRGFHIGVNLDGPAGYGHFVEDLRVDGSRLQGLNVVGNDSVVRGNHVVNTGNSSLYNSAYGIHLTEADGSLVSGNIVSGIAETGGVVGIYISNAKSAEISGNFIFGLDSPGEIRGLQTTATSDITVYRNWFLNEVEGDAAVYVRSSKFIDCIGNISANYTEKSVGCDYEANDHDI